jgi:DNA-binding sugar fermentation-stimulating protein
MEVLMRDNRVIESFLKKTQKKLKEMSLFKSLKKEVEIGANGTQDYIIKKGVNKDTIAKK